MSRFDDYMNELGNAGKSFEAFDQDELSFEQFEASMEVETFLKTQKGYPANKARQIGMRVAKRPSELANIRTEMRKAGMPEGFKQGGMTAQVSGNLQAAVNFKATRLSANIALALPVVFFGSYDAASKYQQSLAGNIPAGVTLTGLDIGKIAGGELNVDFIYTQGLNIDTIRVTMDEYAYPAFLEQLKGSRFRAEQVRYSITDTSNTGLQQLTQKMQYFVRTMFGKQSNDTIPLGNSKSPFQQQNGIVDIIGSYEINAQTSIVLLFQNLANQQVNMSCFITSIDQIGRGV